MLAYGRQTIALLVIGLLMFSSSTEAADLAAQARTAKAAFRILDSGDLDAARADLDAAVAGLEARFARAGDTAQGWQDYLDWTQLQEELAKPEGPELPQLERTFVRLSAGHEGLGLVCFSDLRHAIRRYVSVAKGVEDPNVKARFEKVVDALATSLDAHSKAPAGQDAAMISAYLSWLNDARQTPDLIELVRSASLDPNFHAKVSEELLNSAMGREVDETLPIRDVILGTRIYGTGHATGDVSVQLVPSEDRATIITELESTIVADTTGYNGPVIIHSDVTTHLTSRKQILIDSERLWTLPATADAVANSHFRSIRARNGMRMIERIAWKRACRQKGQAEAIGALHAECQARDRLDDEVDSLIGPANDDIQKKIREPLIERGLYPDELNYSTTKDSLNLSILQAGPFDLGATTVAPEAVADADLSVRIHESMINNFTSAALAGMILREPRVQEAVTNMLGELPEEMKSQEDEEPWGIRFQSLRPVWVAFGDNQFTLSIRGQRFYEGDTPHPAMDVTVTYQIVGEGETVKAVRQGDVQIFPPGFDPEGDKQLSAKDTVIRRILQRRLGKLFEAEIVPEGLVLPEEWRRAGKMKLVQLTAQDGWLALAWKRTGEPAPDPEASPSEVALAR